MAVIEGYPPFKENVLQAFCKGLPKCIGTILETELKRDYHTVLDQLIETAYDPSISISHRGVAINAICSLIGYAKILSIPRPLTTKQWQQSLDTILDRLYGSKAKPMRQLLVCLTTALSNFPNSGKDVLVSETTNTILHVLLGDSDHVKAKPALQILNHFLDKEVITPTQLNHVHRAITKQLAPDGSLDRAEIQDCSLLLNVLLPWVVPQETSITASHAIHTLVQKIKIEHLDDVMDEPVWSTPLCRALESHCQNPSSYRAHLLPNLFRIDPADYSRFLTSLGLESMLSNEVTGDYKLTTDATLLFTCLEVGKECGLLIECSQPTLHIHENILHIPEALLCRAVESATDSIRLSGLTLLVASVSITRPFSSSVFRCVKRNLSHLLMETDLYMRGEVLVQFQRMIDRIKAATGPLSRSITKLMGVPIIEDNYEASEDDIAVLWQPLEEHRDFLCTMINLAKYQLHPAAAYQRHFSGLKVLIMLARSGLDHRLAFEQLSKQAQHKEAAQWPFSLPIFDNELLHSLRNLLLDPFEDVRNLAANLLIMASHVSDGADELMDAKFLSRAEAMMLSSGRADHADGVARANAIAFEIAHDSGDGQHDSMLDREHLFENLTSSLEERIALAKDNLSLAVGKYPMHGALASIRLILENMKFYQQIRAERSLHWRSLHHRLVNGLHDVWNCVKAVLCNDAPEGHIPEDMEDTVHVTTKDILSYCWRALKEASTLLRVIVTRSAIDDQQGMISGSQFESLCHLSFTQLVELRHRGAFSAVAQAFTSCCARAGAMGKTELLQDLFEDTLSAVKAKGNATTRRSAGLPSLVVGVLSASPSTPFFKQSVERLLNEAAKSTSLNAIHGDSMPQVHALNCLRAVFINTTLGPYTEPYVGVTLKIAGDCLTTDIWAIRNCGLMLFRALIDRIFGSADSHNWSDDTLQNAKLRISYDDLPGFLDVITSLLRPQVDTYTSSNALEAVFPALKMLQKISPPQDRSEHIRELVLDLCASTHWHVRDMAARTFAALTPAELRLSTAINLVPDLKIGQNAVHGHLACILWLLKLRLRADDDGYDDDNRHSIEQLESILNAGALAAKSSCPFTRAVLLDILNTIDLHRLRTGHACQDFNEPTTLDTNRVLREVPSVRKVLALHLILRTVQSKQQRVSLDPDLAQKQNAEVEILEFLLDLDSGDPMATLQVIENLLEVATILPQNVVAALVQYLSLTSILTQEQDSDALSIRRRLLVQLCSADPERIDELHPALTASTMEQTFTCAATPTPQLVESTVILWALLVNQICSTGTVAEVSPIQTVENLASVLHCLLHESQPVDLRYAAAKSISNLRNFWKVEAAQHAFAQRLQSSKLTMKMLVYDLLSDDDDEIRKIGTETASQFLGVSGRGSGTKSNHFGLARPIPLRCSQLLIGHMIQDHEADPQLLTQAVLRLTGLDTHATAEIAFRNATSGDSALFAVEKQNLFKDDVREAMLWSQACKALPIHFHAHDQEHSRAVRRFSQWTRDALDLLLDRLSSGNNDDGALGWSSKPDMFVFGMRLWCAVDTLFCWLHGANKRVDKLFFEVVGVFKLCKESDAHPFWTAKLEKIIAKELQFRLRRGEAGRIMRALRSSVSVEP